MKIKSGLVSIAPGMGLTLATLFFLAGGSDQLTHAQSGSGVIRVAISGADVPGCGSAGSPCATVQYAVDRALPGDEVRVAAGVYTGVHNVAGLSTGAFSATQVAVITKSLTVRGGFTTSNWDTSDPAANPTMLDAEGRGRVLLVTGPITATIEGLNITHGGASGLGGGPSGSAAGGGVMVLDATVTISDCTVEGNAAGSDASAWHNGYGGGLYLFNSNRATLVGNLISGNTATRKGHGYGGGMRLEYCPGALLRGNVITGNLGTPSGNGHAGGMHLGRSDGAIIEANLICNNTGSGGANYQGGGLYLDTSNHVTVTGNTFGGNVAGGATSKGGGLYLASANHSRLIGNRIEQNAASTWLGHGGGIYAVQCEDLTLSGNVIVSNAGTSHPAQLSWGGGLYILLGGPISLVNNAIVDNQVTAGGSGLCVEAASPALLHNTFAGNRGGDGSAVHVINQGEGYSTVAMTNSVIVSHTVGVTVAAGNSAVLNGTLWYGNDTDWDGAGTVNHSKDLEGDPAFAADGIHITEGSAAVDVGVATIVMVDIDGDRRPAGLGPDLGADELPVGMVFMPLVLRGDGQSQ